MVFRTSSLFHQRHQALSTIRSEGPRPLRSLLYVPASSPKFLNSSLRPPSSQSDTLIYDLEDSVPTSLKPSARSSLLSFLAENPPKTVPAQPRLAIRINSLASGHGEEDLRAIFSRWKTGKDGLDVRKVPLPVIVVPKVEHASVLSRVAEIIQESRTTMGAGSEPELPSSRVPLIASIESAASLYAAGDICGWRGPGATLSAVMFAAEDYCASTGITRSPSRTELLFARSQIVNTAKAFGIAAIDMVCIDYKDLEGALKEECEEGSRLGFDGKQTIHPAQIAQVQESFSPSQASIRRAFLILSDMQSAELESRGAFGLEIDGKTQVIDEPMVKQARSVLQKAKLLGMEV